MGRALTLGFLACLVVTQPAASTSVLAPTFEELVAGAEQVFQGRVVAVRSSRLDSRAGRAIVTDVTFSIERTLKGPLYAERSLEFLGGTVGEDTLRVEGMPTFRIGDRDVLFVNDAGRPASPIVGFMYGRFRIVRDTVRGVDMIRTHDGRPLASLADVGSARPSAAVATPRGLSLEDFVNAVGSRVRSLRPRP